jgi:hypothetical protein
MAGTATPNVSLISRQTSAQWTTGDRVESERKLFDERIVRDRTPTLPCDNSVRLSSAEVQVVDMPAAVAAAAVEDREETARLIASEIIDATMFSCIS